MRDIKYMISVMQAYADGKEIEFKSAYDKEWLPYMVGTKPNWNWHDIDYRVKPKKEGFAPYESVEEFLEDQRKHGYSVRKKEGKNIYASFVDANVHIVVTDYDDYIKELTPDFFVREFVWADSGTPCGKEIEE